MNPVGLFAKTDLVGIAVFARKDLFWTLAGELVQVMIIRYLAMEIVLTVHKATLIEYSCKDGLRTKPLEFEFHLHFPCGSPSTVLSDFRQSA